MVVGADAVKQRMAAIERTQVRFDSVGVACVGYVYHPAGSGGPVPCVVVGTGFSGTQDTPSIRAVAQAFAEAGFAALTFDYRHFGESHGTPRQLVRIKGQQEDFHAAIRCARHHAGIDPERVALWGTSLGGGHVIAVAADDVELSAWFEGRGFAVVGESWSGWQAAADRPAVAALPTGYQLVDRAVRGVDVAPGHPMVARNGPDVEARLRQTTLYDPRLDLAVLAPDGSVAGYSLFWHDPVTGVGLVEPVRVEDEHTGRGIGYAMISAGLDRLARAGATTLKISWESERAGKLYTRLGFANEDTFTTYRLTRPGHG
jgi:predicted N-acetyltransferase YhbS